MYQQSPMQEFGGLEGTEYGSGKAAGGGTPTFKHYRRDKTNKAPRKRTFVANMTKQPQQLTETLASSARGVGSGLGSGLPAMALATMGSASTTTSAGADGVVGSVDPQAMGGRQARDLESLPVIAPAVVYGSKTPMSGGMQYVGQAAGFPSSSSMLPAGDRQIQFGGWAAGAGTPFAQAAPAALPAQQQQQIFSHGRPAAAPATFSDPELAAALARLEAGPGAMPARPAFNFPGGGGFAMSRAVTTTLDNNAASSFSRAVLTAGAAPGSAVAYMPPAIAAVPPTLAARAANGNLGRLPRKAPVKRGRRAAAAGMPLVQVPSGTYVQELGSPSSSSSPSRSSGSSDGNSNSFDSFASNSISLHSAGVAALAGNGSFDACDTSRASSISSSGMFTGLMMDSAPTMDAIPAAWDPFGDFFVQDFLMGVELDEDVLTVPDMPVAYPADMTDVFGSWSGELEQQQQGHRSEEQPAGSYLPNKRTADVMLSGATHGAAAVVGQSNLAAEVEALLAGMFQPDQLMPAHSGVAPPPTKRSRHMLELPMVAPSVDDSDDIALPAEWLDGLFAEDSNLDSMFF